jgi:hypothetical protein
MFPYLSGTEDLMVTYARNTKATQMFFTSQKQRFSGEELCEHSGYSDVPYLTGTEDLTMNYRRNMGVHTAQHPSRTGVEKCSKAHPHT